MNEPSKSLEAASKDSMMIQTLASTLVMLPGSKLLVVQPKLNDPAKGTGCGAKLKAAGAVLVVPIFAT